MLYLDNNLYIAIALQAVRDYVKLPSERPVVKLWVTKMSGTFTLCAESLEMSAETLQDHFKKIMLAVDSGEDVPTNFAGFA